MTMMIQRFEGEEVYALLQDRSGRSSEQNLRAIVRAMQSLLVNESLHLTAVAKVTMHNVSGDDVNEVRQLVNSGQAGICLMTTTLDVCIEKKGGEK